MAKSAPASPPVLVCTPKRLPLEHAIRAADIATAINPLNHAPVERLARVIKGFEPTRERIAVMTTKYWHTKGVRLTVGFLDNPPAALRKRLIQHMNAWAKTANVKFTETKTDAQVRILRAGGQDGGYWSYLGTDILSIPKNEPTMNLEAFTMQTPESEFHRVVRHETGHTLGCPHEHMRRALVKLIDEKKAIKYFGNTQGWSAAEVKAQVLTPIEESALRGTAFADPSSIMCYQIPGIITKSGKPIVGGIDIDDIDYQFMGSVYPKKTAQMAEPKARDFQMRITPIQVGVRRRTETVR
jgi:hypothetical protein